MEIRTEYGQRNKFKNKSERKCRIYDDSQADADYVRKGIIERDESSKTHVYTPSTPENLVQKEIVDSLLSRVFAGSAAKLVMSALSAKKVSRDELEKIKILISQKEREL